MKKINWQYTFGEILIVIIGITIAFSMNKCAQDTKDQQQKNQYLTNIKNDVTSDKLQLVKNNEEINEKLNLTSEIIPLLATDSPEKMQIIGKIFKVANVTNFTPNNITYQTLINSGDLKLIDDFELKKAIELHYANYDIMFKDYERQETIHKEYLGPYFINNADYDAMRKGQFAFSNEKLLKNIMQSMNGSFMFKQRATEKAIKSCDSLLRVLEKF
ncbi:DUF6090 family protein [Lacinutrix iliipiscaria]|uniref:DUF6090 family protein n=1 Tax=Lacinutrix iliipiscaria TaxID=1230532 RepID=A0ABW5WLN5_9FLAO